tara:strand:- start:5177 stop:5875 length:699 start_codon:yes stop_codon:yes gene_type:complete
MMGDGNLFPGIDHYAKVKPGIMNFWSVPNLGGKTQAWLDRGTIIAVTNPEIPGGWARGFIVNGVYNTERNLGGGNGFELLKDKGVGQVEFLFPKDYVEQVKVVSQEPPPKPAPEDVDATPVSASATEAQAEAEEISCGICGRLTPVRIGEFPTRCPCTDGDWLLEDSPPPEPVTKSHNSLLQKTPSSGGGTRLRNKSKRRSKGRSRRKRSKKRTSKKGRSKRPSKKRRSKKR